MSYLKTALLTLEKNVQETGCQLSEYLEGVSPHPRPTGTLADFVFKNCVPASAFLTKCTNLTKGNLQYQWSLWEILKSSNVIFLKLNWIRIAQKCPNWMESLFQLVS